MTIEELHGLMKDRFDQIQNQLNEIKDILKNIDERLRSIEIDVAEIKGRRLAVKDWLVITCAVAAVIVSIIALVNK